MSKIYSICNAKYSKKGDRVNINLISGKDENVEFACISIPADNSKIKIVKDEKTKKEYLYIKLEIKTEKANKTEKTDKPSLPF